MARNKKFEKAVYKEASAQYRKEQTAKFEARKLQEHATRTLRAKENLYDSRGDIAMGALGMVVPLVVAVFLARMIFSNGNAVINVNTLFMDILNRFGSESWNSEMLMQAIENFTNLSKWTNDTSDILEALKTIAAVVVGAGNFVYLLVALLMQALNVIFFIFDMLFIS